jgi:hypothetical protein
MQDDLVYLASPYTHADKAVMEDRFRAACRYAACLMRRGINVFSPIAHSHPIAQFGLPPDWQFFLYTSKDPWGNDCDRQHGYPVRELYADRPKAEAALKTAQIVWLNERIKELNDGRK